jgi:sugar phosphate isomerase/epimerase
MTDSAGANRPITLFTGQWTDLSLDTLAATVGEWGYDGLELATWGAHLDVLQALADRAYVQRTRGALERHDLRCWAIGAHLVGQAVCDPIDPRRKAILPSEIWAMEMPKGSANAPPRD